MLRSYLWNRSYSKATLNNDCQTFTAWFPIRWMPLLQWASNLSMLQHYWLQRRQLWINLVFGTFIYNITTISCLSKYWEEMRFSVSTTRHLCYPSCYKKLHTFSAKLPISQKISKLCSKCKFCLVPAANFLVSSPFCTTTAWFLCCISWVTFPV